MSGPMLLSEMVSTQIKFEKLLEQKGAVLNGIANDHSALQDALDEVAYDVINSEKTGWARLPAETEAVRIDSTLELHAGLVCFDGQGARIDARNMTSGYAVVPSTRTTVPYNRQANAVPAMRQAKLIGPSDDSTTVDCFGLGSEIDTNGRGCARVLFDNISIDGFRDALYLGDDVYLLEFHNLHAIGFKRYGINAVCGTNSGERISFFGGGFFDGQNVAESVKAIHMPATGGGDLNFNGSSFSYNDQIFDVRSGTLTLNGCHQETNRYANPFGHIENSGSVTPTCVFINGGTIGPTEIAANSRSAIYTVSGDKCLLSARTYLGLYDKSSAIVSVSSGSPQIDFRGSYFDFGGTTHFPTIGTYLNLLYNATFETGNLNGWTGSGTGYTFTADPTVKNSGSYSLKLVSASAGNGNVGQMINVTPGQRLFVSGAVNVTSISAGTAYFRIRFLDRLASIIHSATDVGTWTATTSGFEIKGMAKTVPSGAVLAQVDIAGVGLTGTMYLDDVQLYAL